MSCRVFGREIGSYVLALAVSLCSYATGGWRNRSRGPLWLERGVHRHGHTLSHSWHWCGWCVSLCRDPCENIQCCDFKLVSVYTTTTTAMIPTRATTRLLLQPSSRVGLFPRAVRLPARRYATANEPPKQESPSKNPAVRIATLAHCRGY